MTLKHFCDRCEKEISADEWTKNSLIINNYDGLAIDAIELCDECNKAFWELKNTWAGKEQ